MSSDDDTTSAEPTPEEPTADEQPGAASTETSEDTKSSGISRRGMLLSGSALGLLGLGSSTAAASTGSGQIGTDATPLKKVITNQLNGADILNATSGNVLESDGNGGLTFAAAGGGGTTSPWKVENGYIDHDRRSGFNSDPPAGVRTSELQTDTIESESNSSSIGLTANIDITPEDSGQINLEGDTHISLFKDNNIYLDNWGNYAPNVAATSVLGVGSSGQLTEADVDGAKLIANGTTIAEAKTGGSGDRLEITGSEVRITSTDGNGINLIDGGSRTKIYPTGELELTPDSELNTLPSIYTVAGRAKSSSGDSALGIPAPDGTPTDAKMGESTLAFFQDAQNTDLKAKVKDPEGTVGTVTVGSYSTARMKANIEAFADSGEEILAVTPKTYETGDGSGDERLGLIAEEAHEAGLNWLVDYEPVESAWKTADGINEEYIERYGIERDGETLVPNNIHDRAWLSMHHELIRSLVDARDECEATIETLETDIESKDARLEDQRDRIDHLESKVENKSELLESVQSIADGKDVRIAELEAENAELEARLTAIEVKLGFESTAADASVADD